MSFRSLTPPLLVGLLASSIGWAAAQSTAPMQVASPGTPADVMRVSLPQVLAAARTNLDVALAQRQLASAQADVTSADRAPLPSLSAGVGQIDLKNGNGRGNPMTQKTYDKSVGLDWTWERGNKRELRTEAARRSSEAVAADLDDVTLQQQLAALGGFYDLLAAQERVAEVTQIERSAAELARAAERRLQAGDLSAQDSLRTDIEAQRARSELRLAELERQRAAVALAQITALGSAAQLQAQADWPSLQTIAPTPVVDALVENRADVRAARSRVVAATAAQQGAMALRKSDLTWGISYDHLPGTSTALVSLRMSMPLQWGYAYQGEIARASAQLELAEQALEKTRRLARSELERLLYELQTTAERALSYDVQILPRARRVAEGAELAYRKGALSLTDLLDARRTLRATALDALVARSEHAKVWGSWRLRTETPVSSSRLEPPRNRP